MTEIKKCEDCKFWIPGNYRDRESKLSYAKCSSPNIEVPAPKTAYYHLGQDRIEGNYKYCETARTFNSDCGKEAKYFEPKDLPGYMEVHQQAMKQSI